MSERACGRDGRSSRRKAQTVRVRGSGVDRKVGAGALDEPKDREVAGKGRFRFGRKTGSVSRGQGEP